MGSIMSDAWTAITSSNRRTSRRFRTSTKPKRNHVAKRLPEHASLLHARVPRPPLPAREILKRAMTEGTRPLQIVSMGGGNGLATLLRGLKRYAKAAAGGVEITAVVTVTDDGGSSGRLRRAFDVLPPGDIRNCMVALSQDET